MTAIAAGRMGYTAVILERTEHSGGLPANGLGVTDIQTRGATGGLFLEFVGRIYQHYADTYGSASQQLKDCSDGYRTFRGRQEVGWKARDRNATI